VGRLFETRCIYAPQGSAVINDPGLDTSQIHSKDPIRVRFSPQRHAEKHENVQKKS